MHNRYIPTTPISTASQTIHELRFPRNKKPITGTSSIYIAVINPALPAVVYTIPIC